MSATKHQITPVQAVVITGCSSGIGYAAVRGLVEAGYFVFGSVRKDADAQRLKEAFGSSFEPLLFDVTDEEAVEAAAALVRKRLGGRRLTALINNAGIANLAPLALMSTKDFRQQFEVNAVGPFIVTRAFLAILGTDSSLSGPPGRILMVTSVADSVTLPLFGAYSASKHAERALGNGLRRELAMYGINVVVMSYGATLSSILTKAEDRLPEMGLEGSDYAPLEDWLRKFLKEFTNPKNVLSPEASNRWILSVLQAKHPPSRVYPMIFAERVLINVLGLLSLWTPAIDFLIARIFNFHKLPKRKQI